MSTKLNKSAVRDTEISNCSNSLKGTISMHIYSIYKATNTINGKIYIGFTKNGLRRARSHIYSRKTNNFFHNAIRKYGPENFSWEIIYQSKDLNHTLNTMESYFICEYNSFIDFKNSNGYNLTIGGSLHTAVSEETKNKISISAKIQWQNAEYRAAMCEYNATRWDNPDFLSRKQSSWEITLPTGGIVICLNLAKFCRENKLDDGCMVSVSKGNRLQHKGYTCKRLLAHL